MSNVARITKRIVDRLEPGDLVWDTDVKGFGVRCQSRSRVYILKAAINGRARWFTLGEHGAPWTAETARQEAQRRWGDIRSGVNLIALREARRDQPSIAELCERFMVEHSRQHNKPLTVLGYERNIRNHVLPIMGNRTVAEITRNDIEDFKRRIREGRTSKRTRRKREGGRGGLDVSGGPGASNRSVAMLSKMFNLAEQWGWRREQSNPCRMVQKYPERRMQRFLLTSEIERLGIILDAEQQDYPEFHYVFTAIRLLLFTGARLSEILKLEWKYVDLERGLLHLPDSKTGQRAIFLNAAAIDILLGITRDKAHPYVIAGRDCTRPVKSLQTHWERIRKRADLDDVRIHDLRHSFASIAAANGASLPLIGKLLGHTTPITTQRYAHLVNDPVRLVAESVGTSLTAAMRKS
jgi:integrase